MGSFMTKLNDLKEFQKNVVHPQQTPTTLNTPLNKSITDFVQDSKNKDSLVQQVQQNLPKEQAASIQSQLETFEHDLTQNPNMTYAQMRAMYG